MTSRQTIIDRLAKSLGAFAVFAVIWVILELTASVVNPSGVVSILAGLSFSVAVVALLALIVTAVALLRN